MKFIIISGRSGSGKSISLNVLEDLGYYCIDNLPINLLPHLAQDFSQHHPLVAISVDARNLPVGLNQLDTVLKTLKETSNSYEILYFDADDKTLLKRFSETRRKHPLTTSSHLSLEDALQQEQSLLQPIAELADLRIDTSDLSLHQLRSLIRERINHHTIPTLSLLFESFGYKFGIPVDADYVFDVRCLPNPYWQPTLRHLTGEHMEIADFLKSHQTTQQMLSEIGNFLNHWIPLFIADNRCYLTIAIGCTGGQHRSVYITNQLAEEFRKIYPHVQVRHREIMPGSPS